MVKKFKINTYIIIGLICLLFVSIFIYVFNIKTIEGLDNNKDDFTLTLKVQLSNKQGRIIPFPKGSYNVETKSGKKHTNTNFSMNNPVKINTSFDTDDSGLPMNRIIIVKPIISDDNDKNTNIQDVIPNQFSMDILFNQNAYKLDTISDLKATNELANDKSEKVSTAYLNQIDSNGDLIIIAMGSIYDNNKKKIGNVSMDSADMNNDKAFNINVDIPPNPKNLLKSYINKIKIIFKYPVPVSTKNNMPVPPPTPSQAIIDNIPPLPEP